MKSKTAKTAACLNSGGVRLHLARMKLTLSIVVYLLMGLVIGWGIVQVIYGVYWVLIAGVLLYLLAFAWFGCREH
jgi:hypothetical protein